MEKRLNEITEELRSLSLELETADEERTAAIEERTNALAAEKAGIEADIEERKREEEALKAVKKEERGVKVIETKGDKTQMETKEIRNSEAYINAYANYIKTGDDAECRALLTDILPNGTVPVPEYVEERVSTAWERMGLLARVKRSEFPGVLKVGVELSADPARVHTEGSQAITEENLTLAIVKMNPVTFKKWISFSDEVQDMAGRAFVDYVYDELTYQIAKTLEAAMVALILEADTDNTNGDVAAGSVTVTQIGLADFVNAAGTLAGDIANPIVVTSRKVYAAYKALAMAAQYAVDPFDGMDVVFADGYLDEDTEAITPFATTGANSLVAIVGDPQSLQVNFVNGTEPTLKYDEYTLATSDLVRVIGRLPVGYGYVRNFGMAKVVIGS